jgi:hypothetical protein
LQLTVGRIVSFLVFLLFCQSTQGWIR